MNRTMLLLVATVPGLALSGLAEAATYHVPGDFGTIQAAIDDPATMNFDEIVVAPGSYNEAISLAGKLITLRSSDGPEATIIDAGSPVNLFDAVVRATDDEGDLTRVEGFTLRGGVGALAGAARRGGGLFALGSKPTFVNCIFSGNSAFTGGAVYMDQNSDPKFINCLFHGNSATTGAGLYSINFSAPTLINCTLVRNSATTGGGIYVSFSNGSAGLFNCVLSDNAPDDFDGDSPTVNYSNFFGQVGGFGNISVNPMFVDPTGPDGDPDTLDDNDYRLAAGSPCIDAGNSSAVATAASRDLSGEVRGVDDPATVDTGVQIFGLTVDMGVYEFQIPCGPAVSTCPWDLDDDGVIGLLDLTDLLNNWGLCP